MKTKAFEFNIKAVDDKSGHFEGYLSVFNNRDSYGDVVLPGAFAKSLATWADKGRLPPILWQHYSSEPIGVYTKMSEDEVGLYVEGKLLVDDIPRAREARALLVAKAINGMSIGYWPVEESFDSKEGVNYLKELDLWEGSIVTFPANDLAEVTTVKSLVKGDQLPSLKAFEEFLREAGFSKTQATAIAGRGLKHLIQGEPEPPTADDLLAAIKATPFQIAQGA